MVHRLGDRPCDLFLEIGRRQLRPVVRVRQKACFHDHGWRLDRRELRQRRFDDLVLDSEDAIQLSLYQVGQLPAAGEEGALTGP